MSAPGLWPDGWQQNGQYHRVGECAAAERLGRLGEHSHWQPACGKRPLERAELLAPSSQIREALAAARADVGRCFG